MHNGSVSSIDKSWITHPNRKSDEYQQGLVSFIEMCKDFVDSIGYVRCACARCQNSILIPFIKMKYHMHAYGICRTYRRWTHHGESLIPTVVVADDVTPMLLLPQSNKSRLEAFHNAHTGKDGIFDSEAAERHYNDLKAEFQNQIGPNSDGEFDEESSASHPNEVAVFEKVMGVRRGHTRGIGLGKIRQVYQIVIQEQFKKSGEASSERSSNSFDRLPFLRAENQEE
ncbi:hypothetical protein E3N88_44946 [Mikania micrantha]|uniref:Transposase-associated domain-containing protein n=1 Tax=Mikania micrantha TaxID=192012 RepID=A0A5N6LAL0_9ASTR|nr:hypothetical protein E3N88_44946 [Mikania micrantha]